MLSMWFPTPHAGTVCVNHDNFKLLLILIKIKESYAKHYFYNELKALCQNVYHSPTQDVNGWKYQEQASSKDGLFVAIYTKGNDTAFVIRGTEDFQDVKTDFLLSIKCGKSQFNSAYIYYLKMKAKYNNIIFIGHSLGGSIAQYLGTTTGLETVTFEAYGVGYMFSVNHKENIINYGNLFDPIFGYSIINQIGKIMVTIPDKPIVLMRWHKLENSGDLSTAKELKEIPDVACLCDSIKRNIDRGEKAKQVIDQTLQKIFKNLTNK